MQDRARRPGRSRPASRNRLPGRPPRRRPEGEAPARSRAAFTGRAVVLAVALASVMLALALPLKTFIGQRHAISKLQQQTAEQQKRVDALKAQKQTWNDPAFITAQARERLHFVKPGETAYIVLGNPAAQASAATPAAPVRPASRDPWYTQLWRSVQAADAVPPVPKVVPTTGPSAKPAAKAGSAPTR